MAEKVGEAYVEVRAETRGFESQLGSTLKKIGGALAGGFVVKKATDGIRTIIDAASDMGETMSKNKAVFGDLSGAVETWASTAATTFGQSKRQAIEAAASYGNLLTAMGNTPDVAADMSKSFVRLASDLASFNNTSVDDALGALQSGLSGETEPLKRFGILLNETTLKNKALELGLYSGKGALDAVAKSQATYALVMEQTKTAQGDFARTSDGLANQQRTMAAQWDDMKVKLGEKLLPVAQKVTSFIVGNMGPAFEWVTRVAKDIGEAFKTGASDGTGFEGFLQDLGVAARKIVDWFRENWPTIKDVLQATWDTAAAIGEWLITVFVPTVVEVVTAIVTWWQENWPKIQEAIQNTWTWIETYVIPTIQAVIEGIIAVVGPIVEWWQRNWDDVYNIIHDVVVGIVEVITWVVETIMAAWRLFGDDIVNFVRGTFEVIYNTIKGVIDLIVGIIKTFIAIVTGDWGKAWESIKATVSNVLDAIKGIISGTLDQIKGIIGAVWDGIKLAASTAWNAVRDTITGAIDEVFTFFTGLPGRFAGLVGDFFTAGWNVAKGIVDGIVDALKGVWDAVTGPIKTAINAAIGFVNTLIGAWNAFEFKIPGWDPPGPGPKFGGFTIGVPDLPLIPTLHTGSGPLPGPSGAEHLRVLEAGEWVFTDDQVRALASMGFGGGRGRGDGPLVVIERAEFVDPLDPEMFARHLAWEMAAGGIG